MYTAITLICLLLGSGPAHRAPVVNSRTIVLNYRVESAAPVRRVEVYLTRDGGARWARCPSTLVGPHSVRCTVGADGTYGFFVVLHNETGASQPAPTVDTPPHVEFEVDTTAPLVQVHRVTWAAEDPPGRVRLRVSVIETGRRMRSARMYYRVLDGAGAWRDGGPVALQGMTAFWDLPADVPRAFEALLRVTDAAGNCGEDRIRIEDADALRQRTAGGARLVADEEPLGAARSEASARDHGVGDMSAAGASSDARPTGPSVDGDARVRAERGQAVDLAALTRVRALLSEALAALERNQPRRSAALLRQALDDVPAEPNVQTELANLLVRLRDFDGAEEMFAAAHELAPEHSGALEGLALVATRGGRYHDAEKYLQTLIEREPDVGRHWLHFGNVAHQLGRFDAARTAWERAAASGEADAQVKSRAERRLRWLVASASSAAE